MSSPNARLRSGPLSAPAVAKNRRHECCFIVSLISGNPRRARRPSGVTIAANGPKHMRTLPMRSRFQTLNMIALVAGLAAASPVVGGCFYHHHDGGGAWTVTEEPYYERW